MASHRILFPLDFSEPAVQVLHKAMKSALCNGAELRLLHVVRDEPAQDGALATAKPPVDVTLKQAQCKLETLKRYFAAPGQNVSVMVRKGDVVREILQAIISENIDLVILATHGTTGWRKAELGSIADEIVRLASCPVLTISNLAYWKMDTGDKVSPSSYLNYASFLSELNDFRGEDLRHALNETSAGEAEEKSNSLVLPGVCEADFPFAGSPETKLRFLLNYAILAPSNRNTQPWHWRLQGEMAELYADRMRALPHLDPHDRELVMSCGASLFYLRVALSHFDCKAEIELFPDAGNPDLLARVHLMEEPAGDLISGTLDFGDELFDAISRRHTNRHPFQESEVAPALKKTLGQAARNEGASLLFIEPPEQRLALIQLIAKGDSVQGHDPGFLQETAKWIRTEHNPEVDGIPEGALGGGGLQSSYSRDSAVSQSDKDRLLAWSAPVLAVLETRQDTERDWLTAGQALARVLLTAAADGIQASFFNSPLEVVEMWPELFRTLKCDGLPQMILRLGYPLMETESTPRRSLHEVLTGPDVL